MKQDYFSDRERGARPRTSEDINERVWHALYELIETNIYNGGFGYRFPDMCSDGAGPCGTDLQAFWRTAHGEIPDLPEHPHTFEVPDCLTILDLLQFCAQSVAAPISKGYHSFFKHEHLDFDRERGLSEFVGAVNRLFARNGIAFELTQEGYAERLGPPILAEELRAATFNAGDEHTNDLLETARARFLSPHPQGRQDALEKLWDAFERIKTLEPGPNKRAQADALLDRACPDATPKFRDYLGSEAHQLTNIGNQLRIRHAETDREAVSDAAQVDYLFHRMFGFIRFLLKNTGRGG